MREFRLKALDHFLARKQPTWGSPMLAELDYDDIRYFVPPPRLPAALGTTCPRTSSGLLIAWASPRRSGSSSPASARSTSRRSSTTEIHEDLEKQGVIFTDMDTALREHEDILRQYFATVIPPNDNKLAALNSAVWSGGSFVYVPEGVHVDMPLQAYFRINTENMGQFERTLIIAEPGSYVHYVEGCTAPTYSSNHFTRRW